VASDGAVLDALDQALTPRTRLVVALPPAWNTGLGEPIEAVGPALEQPPSPSLVAGAMPPGPGVVPAGGGGSLGGRYLTPSPATSGVAVQRALGCGPVGANPQRIKTATLGGWRKPGQMRSDAALMARVGCHDPWQPTWSPLSEVSHLLRFL